MELKQGYKQTEVGLIPGDWDCKTLGEIGEALIGLTYKPSDVREFGTLVLRSSNIQDGALAFEDNVFVDADIPERIMVRNGDILICVRNGSRELIGKAAYLGEQAEGMTFGAFMAVHRGPYGRLVGFLFQSDILRRQIHEHLGATINQITNKSLNSFRIPLPRSEREQSAIAAALGNMAALQSELDSYITKQRDLKTAAMQQLLTGKTRLPGFSGKWEVKRLEHIASIRNNKIMPSQVSPGTLCVELEHVGQGNGRLLTKGMAESTTAAKYRFQAGDVLFGRLRSYLRKYWLADEDGICSTEIWPLMFDKENVVSGFLFALVQTDGFIEAASVSYGTHMPRADWGVIRNFEILLPCIEEQTAIAEVFRDIDAQLAALEQQREKTVQLKQGMMQELLIGHTRLL